MMNGGAMGQGVVNDTNQPFDQRFLDQMIMHHQGAIVMVQKLFESSARSIASTPSR